MNTLGHYAGTGFGAEATTWYAEQFNDTGNPVYFLGGAFSALWTPETYLQTAIALAAAPYAAAEITAAGAQSVAAAGRVVARQVVEEVITAPIPVKLVGSIKVDFYVSPSGLAIPNKTLVIGRLKDLNNLRPGEYRLKWSPNSNKSGFNKSEWDINDGLLRAEMKLRQPIRDASPGDAEGWYTNLERQRLEGRGWIAKTVGEDLFWYPPGE
jgi:hypothetical protein